MLKQEIKLKSRHLISVVSLEIDILVIFLLPFSLILLLFARMSYNEKVLPSSCYACGRGTNS